ncbi:DUF2442 domain-containing protein [uncultured Thiodictyon sp.]|jgi:predicted RNase H-related nuclease YkuK (DUF458 family)|uniref:DUF2442 domain-containing protein n=1 Tax=uncultured Thiodictyon sp. TaxID=1846217 RepID=UPI0025EECE6E|nr:DUF2442 domain-containing protein [uncultured Thiodictyon sp.]
MLTIVPVRAIPPATIEVDLSDGKTLTIDATGIISSSGYEPLIAPDQFAAVVVSDCGHGIGLACEGWEARNRRQAA